jgi:EmrB/QacA subfamily drug resistance transporter
VTPRAKTLTLVATILGSGIAFLDGTIVNVALPAIEEDLGGGLAGQQWVVNAYLVTLGSLLLVGGSIGDIFGQRRIFVLGVVAFGVTSLFCAVAPTIELLVAARALQGAASALLTPASLAVIADAFEDPKERGAAIGAWTAWGGIATLVGPLAGGLIVDNASWRWVFAVNVPVVVVTVVLAQTAMPELPGRPGRRIDVVGSVLCALGLASGVFGLIEQPSRGWGDPLIVASLTAGVALLAAFVAWEARTRDPMLPLGLFRRPNFAAANAETLFVYAGLSALFFYLVIFLQEVAGWSALESGLAGLPVTLIMFALSRTFGALAARVGPRLFMGVGPLLSAAGLVPLLFIGRHVSYLTDVLPAMIVFGLGLAMTVAPLTATVMSDAGPGSGGTASGVNNAVARVAGLLGIAATGLVAASGTGLGIDLTSFRTAMAVAAGLVGGGGLIGLLAVRNPG